MNIDLNVAGSRPAGVAAHLVGNPVAIETIYSRPVVLTGEAAALATANGQWIFLDALRLLLCITGQLTVVIPQSVPSLHSQVEQIVSRAFRRSVPLVVSDLNEETLRQAVAVLNIGGSVADPATWTAISSNGWLVRVSSQESLATIDLGQPNPIAALMAASVGVSEVFKRIVGVPAQKAAPLGSETFSLFNLGVNAITSGPDLPSQIDLPDTLLIGAGAIGNGIVLLLSQLPLRGSLTVLDKQDYGVENLGTCLLMEPSGWFEPKAIRLAEWLQKHGSLAALGEKGTIEQAITNGRFSRPPGLVLNALDDVAARRAAQRLWPKVMIDGAINSVGAAVIQHRVGRPDLACLMCWFQDEVMDAKVAQSKVSGLHPDSLSDINRVLTDEDLAKASQEKRAWLTECRKQGKTVCATLAAAELELRLGVSAEPAFRPSVPFVATAAAALVMAEAIKAIVHPEVRSPAMFHLGNLFLGLEASTALSRKPMSNCQCVAHRHAIERMHNTPGALAIS